MTPHNHVTIHLYILAPTGPNRARLATATITASTISGNSTRGNGGGIFHGNNAGQLSRGRFPFSDN